MHVMLGQECSCTSDVCALLDEGYLSNSSRKLLTYSSYRHIKSLIFLDNAPEVLAGVFEDFRALCGAACEFVVQHQHSFVVIAY